MSKKNPSPLRQFHSLWIHLTKRRRYQFALLVLLFFLSAILEAFSLGAIVPFLAALVDPESLMNNHSIAPLVTWLDITSSQQLLPLLALIFLIATFFSAAIRIFNLWVSTRLSYSIGADFCVDCFNKTLHQPYEIHLQRNSSLILGVIVKKVGIVVAILYQLANLLGSVVISVAIIITLLLVDWKVTLSTSILFMTLYMMIIGLCRRTLLVNSLWSARQEDKAIQVLQEGFGSIRDILLDASQHIHVKKYSDLIYSIRIAQATNVTLTGAPRYLMEAIAIFIIIAVTYLLSVGGDGVVFGSLIPLLGAFAIGAQRLLPTLQQIYAAWAGITGNHGSMVDVLKMLNQQIPSIEKERSINGSIKLEPQYSISFSNIQFKYGFDQPPILDGINLQISKGSKLGVIGRTGAGKSTFVDLFMGLLDPTEGHLLIDGVAVDQKNKRAWQNCIAHVPQNIFLIDATFAENIALGVKKQDINLERVSFAAKQAQIEDYILTQPNGYQSIVGERGNYLSGGQLQRIGIARALYRKSSILILDEATSALDHKTEDDVIKAINQLDGDLTVLIVAHRLNALKICDQIIEVANGCIKLHTDFESLIKNTGTAFIDEK
jgi:ATP-binding cassette subfamily B protein